MVDEQSQGSQDASKANDESSNTDKSMPKVTGFDKLLKLTLAHFIVGISVLTLWAAADSWYLLTNLTIASFLSVATALVAGVVVSTIIHEWFHFAGAIFSGASYSIPNKLGLFVFDFDFEKSSVTQFLAMSVGGQLGGVLAVLFLFVSLPMDNPGRIMLLSSAVGSAIFAGLIEWPVILRTRKSQQSQVELGKIDKTTLYRGLSAGIVSAGLIWLAAT